MAAADELFSCEDLIIEILSRLPVSSLLRFKSVNKHWYSLIKRHPNPNPDSPTGVYLRVTHPESGYVFVPYDFNSPVKFPNFTNFRSIINPHADFIYIEHSCNGLMLICTTRKIIPPDIYVITDKRYVFNPTINQLTTVPGTGKRELGMSLAFDPSKSPYNYKIIYVCGCDSDDGYRDIHVYSSQTRTCKLSYKLKFDRKSAFVYSTGVYWNNAIHWIDRYGFIVYFNLDQEMVYEIKTPFSCINLNLIDINYRSYIFESRDKLLLFEIYCPLITKFKIYELKRDYSDWLVKYHVDLEEFDGSLFPKSVKLPYAEYDRVLEFDVLSLVLCGGVDDESFLVVETPTKIVRLNLESKTYHILRDFTSPRITSCVPGLSQWPHVYPYAASLYSFN